MSEEKYPPLKISFNDNKIRERIPKSVLDELGVETVNWMNASLSGEKLIKSYESRSQYLEEHLSTFDRSEAPLNLKDVEKCKQDSRALSNGKFVETAKYVHKSIAPTDFS